MRRSKIKIKTLCLKELRYESTITEEMRIKIEERIYQIEEEIENEISERYSKEIIDKLKDFGGDDCNLNGSQRKKLWELLKRKYPKCLPMVPVGKKDTSGNVITNHSGLKELYLKTYIHRLRNRPIKDELEEIKLLTYELFELRMELSSRNKSKPWT